MDDFEVFMRDKIMRLRAEADALEKTLKEFMGAKNRVSGAARRSGDNPRSGAFGVILEAIAKAGPQGLSLDEMIEAAAQQGYEVKRNTLRSQVWTAKEEGALIQLGAGHYRSKTSSEAAATAVFGKPEPIQPKRAAESFSADLDDEIPF